MIAHRIPRSIVSPLAALAAFTLAALTLTGCGVGANTLTSADAPVTALDVQGIAHGGSQPISNATVQVWAVGTGGYGKGATALGSSVSTSNTGSFSLSGAGITCPSGTTQVYLTVTGGNPGLSPSTATNAEIELVSVLGNCSNLVSGTHIYVNEMTTAAAAVALGQYFTTTFGSGSTDAFGAPNTTQAQIGITNAMATAGNLACSISTNPLCTSGATGGAITTGTISNSVASVTITPEATKLGTFANVLAACVNSPGGTINDGSNCGTLLGNVAPSGATPPTDTLQAAVYMALNPTSTPTAIANLLTLQTSTSPYPDVATVNDWTIGINYAQTTASTSDYFLNDAIDLAADSNGNIWVLNYPSSNYDSIAELSPTGTPLANPLTGTTAGSGLGGYSGRNLAIDQNNNVWVASSSSSGYVFEYNPTSSTTSSTVLGKSPYGVAIDANNNVFIGEQSSSATYSIVEFPSANISNVIDLPLDTAGGLSQVESEYLAVDTSGNLWISGASGTDNIDEMTNLNTSSCTSYPCTSATATYTAVSAGSNGAPWALAAGPGGVIWAPNTTGSVDLISSPTVGTSYGTSTNLNKPEYVAVDGAGNAWVSNKSTGGVTEFSKAGAILSPASTVGFVHTGISGGQGIAIDPSGNVWIANDANGSSTDGNSIFEIVGAATPAVTPISLALKNGTVGSRP